MIFKIVEKILLVNSKILCYANICVAIAVSVIGKLYPPPLGYLTNEDNLLNQYVMNVSYFGMGPAIVSFIILTSSVYCYGDYWKIASHCLRGLLVTVVTIFGRKVLKLSSSYVGFCGDNSVVSADKDACLSKGSEWTSLNVSGHTFFILFWISIIVEECKVLKYWEALRISLTREQVRRLHSQPVNPNALCDFDTSSPSCKLPDELLNSLLSLEGRLTVVIKLYSIVFLSLILLYYPILTATVIYFHTTVEVIVACTASTIVWLIIYSGLTNIPLPGDGFIVSREM